MADLAIRFDSNPILTPEQILPSRPELMVECVLNPGVFYFDDKTWLLLRVAEKPHPEEGFIKTVILSPKEQDGIAILSFKKNDPYLKTEDPRKFSYQDSEYLTTLSHLRLAASSDGIHFEVSLKPAMEGVGKLESFGIEDCRVIEIEKQFYLTYTAVSPSGVGVGMATTTDWQNFQHHGMIFPPHNKDCAFFPEKINGLYAALHRPSSVFLGGNYIWLSFSPDLIHWGEHQCIVKTRPKMWDSERIGAGAAPIKTPHGWLEIYHAADHHLRYCLGALLLDLNDPGKVLARSEEPIMEPLMAYEREGFFSNTIFTNGHIVSGDTVTFYYGAADRVVCGATFSVQKILSSLKFF